MITLPAPAKLNLFLHITGRRDDGYHELQTLFQLLDYGDQLDFTLREDGEIRLNADIEGLDSADNLVFRAARALQLHTQTSLGAEITLRKALPAGGGVGGGSSDAATTLLGLNALWQTGLGLDQLAELGLPLGADVPVFVRGKSAWAEGVGEALSEVELPCPWYLVIYPQVHVSTGTIFADKDLTRNTQPITLAAFLSRGGHNDCEPVARRLFPEVNKALEWLSEHGEARLTGTGACVFASYDTLEQAEAVGLSVPAGWQWFTARGVNTSPLHQALDKLC